MNDSKLEADEFIEKYAKRIRDILLFDWTIESITKEINNLYYWEEEKIEKKLLNWQKWKILEWALWNYVFNKIKDAGLNNSN
jgi:hypothetical protein